MRLYEITEQEFFTWLDSSPSEDELREAYFVLEAKRQALWTPGDPDSYRRDRFDRDARYVSRLVRIKAALADLWETTKQIPRQVDPMYDTTGRIYVNRFPCGCRVDTPW